MGLPFSRISKKALCLALTAAFLFFIVFVFIVFQSGDAQGAIGLFFGPIYALAVAVIGFLLFCSVGILVQWIVLIAHHGVLRLKDKVCILASILFLVFFIGVVSFVSIRLLERAKARSPQTPLRALYVLYEQGIKTNNQGILENLAKNPNIPHELLYRLYDYAPELDRVNPYSAGAYSILIKIAYNPATPAPLLEKLSASGEKSIRYYVATNPNTPEDVLLQLTHDSDPLVQQAARFSLQRRGE